MTPPAPPPYVSATVDSASISVRESTPSNSTNSTTSSNYNALSMELTTEEVPPPIGTVFDDDVEKSRIARPTVGALPFRPYPTTFGDAYELPEHRDRLLSTVHPFPFDKSRGAGRVPRDAREEAPGHARHYWELRRPAPREGGSGRRASYDWGRIGGGERGVGSRSRDYACPRGQDGTHRHRAWRGECRRLARSRSADEDGARLRALSDAKVREGIEHLNARW